MYSRWCSCWDSSFSKLSFATKEKYFIFTSTFGTSFQTIHSRSTQAPVSASLEWDDKQQDRLEKTNTPSAQHNSSNNLLAPRHQLPNGDSNFWNVERLSIVEEQNGVNGSHHSSLLKRDYSKYEETNHSFSPTNGDHQVEASYTQCSTTLSESYSNPSIHSSSNNNISSSNSITISLSTTHSNSSQSVLSALNKLRGQSSESSDLAKFIAHESGKYYDLSKSYRHIRQENAYVHAFLKTRMDCPNTSVILPETVGNDRVFRFKERNIASLFNTKATVNRESSWNGNVSDTNTMSNNNTSTGGTMGSSKPGTPVGSNSSGTGRKRNNTSGRLVTQRILEEEADQREKTQKEFEEKIRDVLKRKGKFSLDEETAKELVKEYSRKKFSSGQTIAKSSTEESNNKSRETVNEEEQQLYPKEIPKNKKEEPVEPLFHDELRARLKQLEKKPNFTNLVDISQLVKVFPQDHWSAEQVNRLALFIQQTHGLSATTRLERLTKFIHQLNEEVRKSQEEKPMLETKRTRGRKPFQGSSNKQQTSATRKQGKK